MTQAKDRQIIWLNLISLLVLVFILLEKYSCVVFILVFVETMLLITSFILLFAAFLLVAEKHRHTFFVVVIPLKQELYRQAFEFLMKSPEIFLKQDFVMEHLNNPKINQSI